MANEPIGKFIAKEDVILPMRVAAALCRYEAVKAPIFCDFCDPLGHAGALFFRRKGERCFSTL
jgi:hypothetical protein